MNDCILGVLGRAQANYSGIELHAFVAMGNHMHLLMTVRNATELAAYMAFINGNIARRIGQIHDWPDRFWGSRYSAVVVADEQAQLARVQYIFENGAKEGRVAHPSEWPGANSIAALVTGEPLVGTWRKQSRRDRALNPDAGQGTSGETITYVLKLSPLPCWHHLDEATRRNKYSDLLLAANLHAAQIRAENEAHVLGADRILAGEPHERPLRIKRRPPPLVHATTSEAKDRFKAAYEAFVAAYREATERLRRGGADVEFPPAGCPLPCCAPAHDCEQPPDHQSAHDKRRELQTVSTIR